VLWVILSSVCDGVEEGSFKAKEGEKRTWQRGGQQILNALHTLYNTVICGHDYTIAMNYTFSEMLICNSFGNYTPLTYHATLFAPPLPL